MSPFLPLFSLLLSILVSFSLFSSIVPFFSDLEFEQRVEFIACDCVCVHKSSANWFSLSFLLFANILLSSFFSSFVFFFLSNSLFKAREVLLIGLLSFALFFENVVVIFFTAIMTFKIKGIGPPAQVLPLSFFHLFSFNLLLSLLFFSSFLSFLPQESYHFNYESQHDQLASPIMTSNSMRDRERDDDEYIEFGEDVYSRSFDKV